MGSSCSQESTRGLGACASHHPDLMASVRNSAVLQDLVQLQGPVFHLQKVMITAHILDDGERVACLLREMPSAGNFAASQHL